MEDLVLIGAGALAREVLDAVAAAGPGEGGYRVAGACSDDPDELEALARRGVVPLGPVAAALEHRGAYVLAMGDGATRARIESVLATAAALRAATVVHPMATIGSDTTLGAGTLVLAGARLSCDARLGRHVVVRPNATVGHDCVLGDHVTLGPGVHLSGHVRIGARATLGAGAVVIPRVQVGPDAVVEAGATVLRDLPDGARLVPPASRLLPSS